MDSRRSWVGAGVVVAFGVAILLAVFLWQKRPRVSEEEVRGAVVTTLRREVPQAFLVTGALDVTATTTVANEKVFLPGIVNFSLGSAEATVRVPGRVSYGFDVRALKPSMIQLAEGGLVEVTLPALQVYSVEPDLSAMSVKTSTGWLRTRDEAREVERKALGRVQGAMRTQAAAYLEDSTQPRINTARALEKILTPALKAAGVEDPRFRFRIGKGVVVQPER